MTDDLTLDQVQAEMSALPNGKPVTHQTLRRWARALYSPGCGGWHYHWHWPDGGEVAAVIEQQAADQSDDMRAQARDLRLRSRLTAQLADIARNSAAEVSDDR